MTIRKQKRVKKYHRRERRAVKQSGYRRLGRSSMASNRAAGHGVRVGNQHTVLPVQASGPPKLYPKRTWTTSLTQSLNIPHDQS